MCGEKFLLSLSAFVILGSPPRVRGKDKTFVVTSSGERITPACAGKSHILCSCKISSKDHPRVCGEKAVWHTLRVESAGSPPRVRGKDKIFCSKNLEKGITPACAGKRHMTGVLSQGTQDHPRVCGEKTRHKPYRRFVSGSPPRVRGKAVYGHRPGGGGGITPACAGKRKRVRGIDRPAEDHPRVCGEKVTVSSGVSPPMGSPPRVRGKGRARCSSTRQTRITPACAGKSSSHPHFSTR